MAEQINTLITASLVSSTSPEARYQLDVPLIRIGRSVSGPHDIRLPDDDLSASREHALLIYENGAWFLEDRSRNGTWVNDRVIHKAKVRLNNGDRIKIGHSFSVVFRALSETTQSEEFSMAGLGAVTPGSPFEQTPEISVGLWLSPNGIVWRDGRPLPVVLSRTEYRLLRYLMQHAKEVCEYKQVLQAVWDVPRKMENLYELIHRVRRKIEPNPAHPRYLQIRAGVGLVLLPTGQPLAQDAPQAPNSRLRPQSR